MEKTNMTDDAMRAAALRAAEEHGLDPAAVLKALDENRELPPDLQAVLSGLGDVARLTRNHQHS